MDKPRFKAMAARGGWIVAVRSPIGGYVTVKSGPPGAEITRAAAEGIAARLNALHAQVMAGCIPGKRIPVAA